MKNLFILLTVLVLFTISITAQTNSENEAKRLNEVNQQIVKLQVMQTEATEKISKYFAICSRCTFSSFNFASFEFYLIFESRNAFSGFLLARDFLVMDFFVFSITLRGFSGGGSSLNNEGRFFCFGVGDSADLYLAGFLI